MTGVAWVLLGSVAAVAAINWWSRWVDQRAVELVSKPLATVVAGVLCAVHGSGAAMVIAVIAFALCLAGDVALLPAVDQFLAGLAAFLLGHVAFIAAFVAAGLDRPWLAIVAVAALLPVLAGPGRRILASAGKMRGPVAVYLIVIAAMALAAWATGRGAAAIGASLFVASDTILGWGRFVSAHRLQPVAVMVTYHAALTGLALSF